MDEHQLLRKVCGPVLYRNNAFRVLGVPIDAGARDINRQRDKILMAQRLGSEFFTGNGPLTLRPAPGGEDIRLAVESLQDPGPRLIQELFWFWPGEAGNDPGLRALQEGAVDDALYLWLDAERQGGGADIARHNLAVLAHFLACECEHQFQNDPKLAQADRAAANDFWARAFRRWSLLTRESRFWDRVADRIRALKDPQLTVDMAEKLRLALGAAVLAINADFAVKALEAGNQTEAGRHITLIKQSGFAADTVEQALRRASDPIAQRITSLSQKIKKAVQDQPAQALSLAQSLFQESQAHLAVIALFFEPGNIVYESAHDEVALVALQCETVYGNQTRDWKTCLELLQKIGALAGGASTKQRVEESASVVRENLLDALCQKADGDSKTDPAHADQAARTLLTGAESVWPFLAPSHPRYELLHDVVASCALSCQVIHGNHTKDWKTSLELLQLMLTVAVGSAARKRIDENMQIVRENLISKLCQEADAQVKAKPFAANQTAQWLLNETRPLLAQVTPETPHYQEIHDAVALCALDCAIVYGNTIKGWSVVLQLVQQLQPIAVGQMAKKRIADNMNIVTSNMYRTGIYMPGQLPTAPANWQPTPASGANYPAAPSAPGPTYTAPPPTSGPHPPSKGARWGCVALVIVAWLALDSGIAYRVMDMIHEELADLVHKFSLYAALLASAYFLFFWGNKR